MLGDTRDEFGGSEWAHVVHDHLGGMPPHLDLEAERQLGQILVAGSRDGMFTAAHDVSDGGLAVALVEMALRSGVGARCWVPDGLDPFVFLLSESATRAVVVVARSEELRFTEMCAARGFPATRIGVVDWGSVLSPACSTTAARPLWWTVCTGRPWCSRSARCARCARPPSQPCSADRTSLAPVPVDPGGRWASPQADAMTSPAFPSMEPASGEVVRRQPREAHSGWLLG